MSSAGLVRLRSHAGIAAIVAAVVLALGVPASAFAVTAGRITGHVQDTSGTALAGITVDSYTWDDVGGAWILYAETSTDATGAYEFAGLLEDSYALGFFDSGGTRIDQYWQGRSNRASADPIDVLAGNVYTCDVTLVFGGEFSGNVYDGAMADLAGIDVDVYSVDRWGDTDWVMTCTTDGTGWYQTDGLPVGYYFAKFSDPGAVYADEWWNDKSGEDDADDILISAGSSIGSIDAVMSSWGRMTGTVTDLGGEPLGGIAVSVSESPAGGSVASTYTDDSGDYDLDGLNSRAYYVHFEDPTGVYRSETYDDAESVWEGTEVRGTRGATVPSIDASLPLAGRISGKVGDTGSTELEGITVYLVNASGWEWDWYDVGSTDATGTYEFRDVGPGDYVVRFEDEGFPQAYATEYWDDQALLSSADTITIATGTVASSIDASLATLGHVTGKVTDTECVPIADVEVRAYAWSEGEDGEAGYWDPQCEGETDASGDYDIAGLDPGKYRIMFWTQTGSTCDSYTTEVYDDQPSLDEGQDVTVTLGSAVSGVDASLTVGGHITGAVHDTAGTPLANVRVRAYRADGRGDWDGWGSGRSDSAGNYDVRGLDTGNYRVRFDLSPAYRREYWDDRPDADAGGDVYVTRGTYTTSIDATLTRLGSIEGTVRNAAGDPLDSVTVYAYQYSEDWGWDWVDSEYTNASGVYRIRSLEDGVYRVGFEDEWWGLYAAEYWNDKPDVASANDVTVAGGLATTSIDATLGELGSATSGFRGYVRNGSGVPLKDAAVAAYVWDEWGWDFIGDTRVDRFGRYDMVAAAGEYRVGFDADFYAREYYDDVPRIFEAETVTVQPGLFTEHIDATLSPGGDITGHVRNESGAPLTSAVDVIAYVSDGDGGWNWAAETWIGADGSYTLECLGSCGYKVYFSDYSGEYTDEYYNDKFDIDSATTVTVTASATVSGIDATLTRRGHITGTVSDMTGTLLPDILVKAWAFDEEDEDWWFVSDRTDASGRYDIGGLGLYEYYVEFVDSSGAHQGEYYDDMPDRDWADPLAVPKGGTLAGIDASLGAPAGHIAGHVGNGTGGVGNVWVTVYEDVSEGWGEWEAVQWAPTDYKGDYSFHGLPFGTYRVCFADEHPTYARQYWNAQHTLAAASDLVLGGTDRNNIDATLMLNAGPTAVADSYMAQRNSMLEVPVETGVLANDTDPDADDLYAEVSVEPTHGTLCLEEDGYFTYEPDAGYTGPDTFVYKASDGRISDEATVSLRVISIERVAAGDRYGVATAMARRGWYTRNGNSWAGLEHVIVACGESGKEADPLAAAGLAGVYDAPVLLTKTWSLPTTTKNTIRDIAAANTSITVHIVGGTASVPDARKRAIDAIPGVNNVKRVAGADRYAVTANIARAMISAEGTAAGFGGVLIVCSEDSRAFYDALAASPASFNATMPMLGVKRGSVPSPVRSVLDRELAGKTRYAVSSATYINADAYARAGCTQRLTNSANVFTAATHIANAAMTNRWLDEVDTGITAKLSDSLGGGAYMGHIGGVMLYTTSTWGMQSTSRSWVTNRKAHILRGWVFGGTLSIPSRQQTQFVNLLR